MINSEQIHILAIPLLRVVYLGSDTALGISSSIYLSSDGWGGVLGGSPSLTKVREGEPPRMEVSHCFPLGEGIELTRVERQEDQLVLHITATSPSAVGPLRQQPATRLHSRYRRVVKDLPCAGQAPGQKGVRASLPNRANCRFFLVFARAFSSPDLALFQQCIYR